MALISDWKENRLAKKIRKNGHYLTLKTSSKDGRLQAIEILKEIGTKEAISAMLLRFRLTVPELTQDEDEKDYVSDIITKLGEKAKEPLIDFINRYDEVMRPLRLLAKLLSDEEITSILIEKIQDVDELYSSMRTIKIVEILKHLSEYKTPNLVPVALKFINSGDDEVVIEAIDVLATQADEETRIPLLTLASAPDTTMRIIIHIGEMFEKLKWSIKGIPKRKQLEARLKSEFHIKKGGFLKRRHPAFPFPP